jgi:3-deoxy-D-manno-octulosonic-acid transferase
LKFSLKKKIFASAVFNLYQFLWHLFLPFALLYFFYRSLKEPGYASNLAERLGFYRKEFKGACWCHAVSLGEFRAARPIFKKLLVNREKLLITTLTLSGKSAAQQEYRKEIKEGKVLIVYAPLEINLMFKSFLKNFKPRCCIILECDLWPVMITATYKSKIPLIFAHAQYPEKGFIRDKKFPFLKASLIEKFDLILSKSARHKKRFEYFGAKKVLIMGDARFEQTIPSHQIVAASKLKNVALKNYFTICFASIGKQEFTIISEIIRDLHKKHKDIFFILVPRHPNDFDKYKILFEDSSITVKPRSEMVEIKSDFKIRDEKKIKHLNNFSLLWGDSLGELNFYMAMSDLVFMGDSLNNEGSHNIIEPFALQKPVLVGPSIWGIEYPALEALDVGILKKISGQKELASALVLAYHDKKRNNFDENQIENIKNFYKSNQGASGLFMDQMFNNKFLELNNN